MTNSLLLLIFAHILADYPLQGDFMAKAKNHKLPVAGVPFYWPLFSHAFIHACGVLFVTKSLTLFCLELVFHSLIDFFKCDGKLTFGEDQILHILCKVFYLFLLSFFSVYAG